MTDGPLEPSTPEAVAATAQSRGKAAPVPAVAARDPCARLGKDYRLGRGVERVPPAPFERKHADPVYRPLRIYTIDPAVSRLEGSVALVNVPYEPLEPGPEGALFSVEDYDGHEKVQYRRADLDDRVVLMRSGYDPSPSEPRFHQQMVYAVCSNVHAAFQTALGRQLGWGFRSDRNKLVIRPHAFRGRNAYYDEQEGVLLFGYYKTEAQEVTGRTLPGSIVFTCLSHDVIAHEVTHALLDGLRAHFSIPSGADVIAFHEAFADLIALFQRFSYKEVVRTALRNAGGSLEKAEFLTGLAHQFGHTTGKNAALRSAIDSDPSGRPKLYDEGLKPHDLGSVLVGAVFEAFVTVFRRKTARYLRLATNGTGVLPPGVLPADLQDILAEKASKLANQFLSILIRAIDYCPPVDLRFGEYLRALITADYDLVPDDVWAYREALIDAFLRRNIYPRHVTSLSEEALLWRPTVRRCGPIEALNFANLRFKGDPGRTAGPEELRRQACVLGECVTRPEYRDEFGLVADGDPRLAGDTVSLPRVESIRSSRRVGPDGQIAFDLVAEVTQRRTVRAGNGGFECHGGSTVILGSGGEIRYVISKSVVGEGRVERRRESLLSKNGQRYWTQEGDRYVPKERFFRLLDEPKCR